MTIQCFILDTQLSSKTEQAVAQTLAQTLISFDSERFECLVEEVIILHKKYREDSLGKIPIGSHWQSEMSVEPLLISNLIWSLIISDCGWYGHYNNNYIYI
jgi:hypothetical protein